LSQQRRPRIQLLHTDSCTPGSTEAAREAVEVALGKVGLAVEVEDVLVLDEDESRRYGMIGGPAVMVDGRDVDPAVRDMKPGGLGCRAYITPEGIRSAPPVAMIVAALEEALAGGR
jgi:hypothetical protein